MSTLVFRYSRAMVATVLISSSATVHAESGRAVNQGSQPSTTPCCTKAEHRQFDFWVGDWDVTDQGKRIATSSIQQIVGCCIVLENYSEESGYTGKSFNFYDETLGKWRQTWVDGIGNVSEFQGEYRDSVMRFEGETHRSDGTRVLRRMSLFNLGPERVRQYSERSVDGGKTWSKAYDYMYIRKQ